MNKNINIEDKEFEILENEKEGFDLEELKTKYTDFYDVYDYILGDWAYGKLRLKGFCEKTNKNFKKINDISVKNEYIKENCAYNCKYFLIKRVYKK